MTVQHDQMLLQIGSLANNIAQACTDLNNILAAGTQFDREADPTSIAQARTTMEALQGALNRLPSLEAGLVTLEAQLSRQDDSQAQPFAFQSRLIDRLQSAMFLYQTRIELAESIGPSGTRPTSEEISSSVKLCDKIEQTLDTIKVRKLDLLRDRAKLRRLHNRWLVPHPISQLPPELLSHVFLLVDDTRPDFKQLSNPRDGLCLTQRIFPGPRLPAPVTLSHVSADWRAAALATASLWNWIDVRGGRAQRRRVGTWLARSGGLPLHLHVTIGPSHCPSDIADMIVPYLQRVKDIQIDIQSSTGIEFLSRLASASDPSTAYQLSVLKVHNRWSSRAAIQFGEEERALFSQLDLLVLSDVGISGWPEWQVEKACIYVTNEDRGLTLKNALGPLLWGLPLLKELDIWLPRYLYEAPSNEVPPEVATFPSLSKMNIHQSRLGNIKRLLAIMEAPKLDSLDLRCRVSEDVDIDALTDFVGRHPSLRQLTLDISSERGGRNLPDFLESFPYSPSLETLTLMYGPGDPALPRIRSAEQNLPNVKFLRLHRMFVSLGVLKNFMLGTRQPLSLHLDNCSVTVPSGEYPPAHLEPLVEADMKTLTRDPDVTLSWSEIRIEFER
ncbi:hypothetical protein FRC04_009772 [Tulasnella sp. 424]|nr:hypothetical protein FRC04_009772 [Tulasnella sp. 424]KAG8971142.1 hypothetical protein FRC05_011426 [Tulasnella sp. 425]